MLACIRVRLPLLSAAVLCADRRHFVIAWASSDLMLLEIWSSVSEVKQEVGTGVEIQIFFLQKI